MCAKIQKSVNKLDMVKGWFHYLIIKIKNTSWHNCSNKCCDVSEAVELVMELTDKGIRKRAYQHVVKYIMLNFQSTVKSKTVVIQKTTTSQLQITIKQQYCWNCMYDNYLSELLKRSTGLCTLSKKKFKEVILFQEVMRHASLHVQTVMWRLLDANKEEEWEADKKFLCKHHNISHGLCICWDWTYHFSFERATKTR